MKIERIRFRWIWSLGLIFCGLVLLMGCSSSQAEKGLSAKVQRVVSGQTIDIISPTQPNLIERVRLIGIDAPDLEQEPWGRKAKEKLEELLSQKGEKLVFDAARLELGIEEKDDYGRRLAYVWHQGILVNEALVKSGYALAIARSPNQKYTERLERAQEYARIMGYGIWNPKQPMRVTPAEFRSQPN